MMPSLEPCCACERHIRSDETRCPFCGESMHRTASAAPESRPRSRLRRALLFAFRAGLAGSAAAGCGDDVVDGSRDAGVPDGAADAAGADADATPDAARRDAGSEREAPDAGDPDPWIDEDAGLIPIYAAPPPDTPLPGEKE